MNEVSLYVLTGSNLQMLVKRYNVQDSVNSMFPFVGFVFFLNKEE